MAKAKAAKKRNGEGDSSMSISFKPFVIIKRVLQGRIFLSFDFFRRYWIYIACLTMMTLMYIANKYECQKELKQVIDLKIKVNDSKTDFVNASAKYNSLIRESQMTEYLDTMKIGLVAPDQPPYILDDK